MCELEKAVEQLKSEGFTSEQIKAGLDRMKKLAHPSTRRSLDELLDEITDENRHEEIDFGKPVGREII